MDSNRSVHPRILFYSKEQIEKLKKDLQIPEQGYSEAGAEASRRQYGSNTIRRRTCDTVIYRLRRAFINPFTVILFVLAVVSFVTDVLLASNFSRSATAPILILGMLLAGGLIRFAQEMRAKRAADHVSILLHSDISALRSGCWTEVPSSGLAVGDRVRLSAGDRVPADIRLTETDHLFISQSVITGESSVLEKTAAPLIPGTIRSLEDYRNIAFMGSAVISGTGTGIVLAVGRDTVYGGAAVETSGSRNAFDQGANSIAWVLIRFMAVLIPVVFISCGLTKGNWMSAFLFALSVAVGLTPEMLPMVINACLARGSISMSRKQTVVKNISAMQAFGSMDILCVDKTGTLTGDTVSLEYYMDILGNESLPVLDLAYLSSLHQAGRQNHLDAAILRYGEIPEHASRFRDLADRYEKLEDLPFHCQRKSSGVLLKDGSKTLLIVKGNVDEVFRRCTHVEYRGERAEIGEDGLASVHAVVDEMAEDGMKVLAVACRSWSGVRPESLPDGGLTLLGYLAFFDAPKKTAAAAIEKLRALHVGIRVLTGDQKNVALSVCGRLGIDTSGVITGEELERLPEDRRAVRIETATVFAELSPKQKVTVVSALQANGHTVGFLGDGMNDLPAIAEADVGISVDTAVEAVKESADVILLKKDLNVLEEGVLEGRKAFANMSKYIRITASSNFGNIFSIVIASIFLPFLPIAAVQLLLLNLLYDTLCLVLPWDHVDAEVCSRPLEWSGRTLGRFMKFFGPISSVFDIVTFLFLFFFLCPAVCEGSFSSLADAGARREFVAVFQTGWFLESMWTQVLILHLLRTKRVSLLRSRPSRPVLLVTTLGILLFTALIFTPAGRLIGLTSLPAGYFIFLIAVVFLYLLTMTVAKKRYLDIYGELL